ncbi:MAG: (d)CMP kinase [Gammaproteobacteria bacterium]|nr:(d)CMP kinase [Gammaproteobacteria bacterium]
MAPVLTVDGPSGAGKSSVCRLLAERLGWHFLDSGALYRVLALRARAEGIGEDDTTALAACAAALRPEFEFQPGEELARVSLDGQPLGEGLRSEDTGALASRLAAVPPVRQALLAAQRAQRREPGLVADGRDMGSTVFPDATLKIFLEASPVQRAERRHKQLIAKGLDASLPVLVAQIQERDERDARRQASPLRPAPDAFRIDSSALTLSQVVDRIWGLLQERMSQRDQDPD